MQKINLLHVIQDHLGTLRVVGREGTSWVDVFLFFGVPAILTAVLWHFCVFFSDDLLGHLSVAFSIIFGFLLNVQVLIFSMGKKSDSADKILLMREMISNVSFAIMIALLSLIIIISMLFLVEQSSVRLAMNVTLYYFVFVLILNILMIFKRIHTALQDELKV